MFSYEKSIHSSWPIPLTHARARTHTNKHTHASRKANALTNRRRMAYLFYSLPLPRMEVILCIKGLTDEKATVEIDCFMDEN